MKLFASTMISTLYYLLLTIFYDDDSLSQKRYILFHNSHNNHWVTRSNKYYDCFRGSAVQCSGLAN